MAERDPYVLQAQAGEADRTLTPSGTTYVLAMAERATRKGYEIEGAIANTGTISIRYGASGTEYEIVAGGSHMRTPATGGVFKGDIYVKTTVGGEKIIIREW